MTRRLLFPALTAGLLILSFGSLNARAGQIALPTTLDQLLPAGTFAVVPPEPDIFSNFVYTVSPAGSPPLASNVAVNEFHLGNEAGITFAAPFFAAAGSIVDYRLQYVVTAPAGFLINDAFLGAVYDVPGGSNGIVSISESLFNNITGASIGSLGLSSPPGTTSDTLNFAGVQSILVQKDILLVGGNNGIGVSIIDQGFSSAVPEPASMALLGIGLSGLLTFRRFFKRAPSA